MDKINKMAGKYLDYLDCGSTLDYSDKAQKQFNLACHACSSLYLSSIEQYQTGEINKVRIEFEEKLQQSFVEDWIDVAIVHLKFDFETWYEGTKKEKKKLIVEKIHEAMLILVEQLGWNKEPLQEAIEQCRLKEYTNYWQSKHLKIKSSPNRQFKGAIDIDYDIDACRIFAIIYDKEGTEIHKYKLMSKKYDEDDFVVPIDIMELINGKTKWENKDFVLYDQKQKEVGRVSTLQFNNKVT